MENFLELGILGSLALVFGVVYVILASRTNYYAWYFGIASCAIIAFEDFTRYGLFADGLLQIFYVLMGGYALFEWGKTDKSGRLIIVRKSLSWHIGYILLLLLLSIILGWVLNKWTEANLPYIDMTTSVMAVFATWLMVRRVLSNWIYWIIIDLTYLYIYGSQGAWFYVVLTMIYTLVAIYGYFEWSKRYRP
ncbi:MAG: nicotinamide riboside transporter PnuC [Saprospiraceae bacterium]|nr:nicotinamide riboside transporter PnuC [Saprospiraceae bacterium]